MRDFLIKNVSNIYCLLKMDDLEVFGITKSCFEMNYLTVVGPQVPPFPHWSPWCDEQFFDIFFSAWQSIQPVSGAPACRRGRTILRFSNAPCCTRFGSRYLSSRSQAWTGSKN